MIIAASVCSGTVATAEIKRQFGNPLVSYIHLHHARRACSSCSVRWVPGPDDET